MRALATGLVVAIGLLAGAAQASAQDPPDPSCPGPGTGQVAPSGSPQGNGRVAETFTVQRSAELVYVAVDVFKLGGSSPGIYHVQIVSTDSSGTPTNNILTQTLISDTGVPSGTSTVGATVPPLFVNAGQTIAIVVTRPGSNQLAAISRSGDPCAGQAFVSQSQLGPFSTTGLAGVDLVYEVQFSPAPDMRGPETQITVHPKPKTRKRSAYFSFVADEAPVSFECSLDGAPFTACTAPVHYTKLKRGKHHFDVRATDKVGNVDATPEAFDWKVKKRNRKG
jgi:hypothetical protein